MAEMKKAGKPAEESASVKEPARESAPAKESAPKLAPAAASGDAGVQNLLGRRAVAASHPESSDELAEIDRQLAELGFTAQ